MFIKEADTMPDISEAEKRIFKNLQGSIYNQFQDLLGDFQIEQSEIKLIKEEKTVRNAEIIMERKLDASERDKVLHNPKMVQEIFNAKLMKSSSKLENAVFDLEERTRELMRLEKSVNQVHQMFVQFAIIVNAQGQIIDDICENIAEAKSNVLAAEQDIVKSKKNMQSARKKKCIILIVIITILLCILGPVLGIKLSRG
jgi:syntaxin 1B/2/3